MLSISKCSMEATTLNRCNVIRLITALTLAVFAGAAPAAGPGGGKGGGQGQSAE
jgi:hypothetical protein